VRIVEGEAPATRYGERPAGGRRCAPAPVPGAKRPVVGVRRAMAQNLYAPLRTVEPVPASAA
jgi:hypothetical protein